MLMATELQTNDIDAREMIRSSELGETTVGKAGEGLAFEDLEKRRKAGGLPENVTKTSEMLDAQLQALKIEVQDMLRSDRDLISAQRERELLAESSSVMADTNARILAYTQQGTTRGDKISSVNTQGNPEHSPPSSPYFTLKTQQKSLIASASAKKKSLTSRSPWRSPSRGSPKSYLGGRTFGKRASITREGTIHTSAAHSTGSKKGIIRRLKAALHTEQALRFSADATIRELRRENEVLRRQIDILHKYEDKYHLVKKEYAHLKKSFQKSEQLRLEQKRIIEDANLLQT